MEDKKNSMIVHNDFLKIKFGAFTKNELDLLLVIMFKLKDQETKEVRITKKELNKLLDVNKSNEMLESRVESLMEKFVKLHSRVKTAKKISYNSLFETLEYFIEEREIGVSVTKHFVYLLNNFFDGNYTTYDLKTLLGLKSKHMKILYKNLKRWDQNAGGKSFWEVSRDDFYKAMGVEGYTNSNISRLILNPATKEMPKWFPKFELHKFTADREKVTRGKRTAFYRFEWETPEKVSVPSAKKSVKELFEEKKGASEKLRDIKDVTPNPEKPIAPAEPVRGKKDSQVVLKEIEEKEEASRAKAEEVASDFEKTQGRIFIEAFKKGIKIPDDVRAALGRATTEEELGIISVKLGLV